MWTFVLTFLPLNASAGLFPFLKCNGSEDGKGPICQFCLASSAGGSNKVCSKPYSTSPGANDPTPGIGNISKELTDDLSNKLIKIKEFPQEGFDVKDFYKKYAEYSCDRADEELAWIKKQIEYLKWKKSQIEKSKKQKQCK